MTEVGVELQLIDLVGVVVVPGAAVTQAADTLFAAADVAAQGVLPDGGSVSGVAVIGTRGEECVGTGYFVGVVGWVQRDLCERQESVVTARVGEKWEGRLPYRVDEKV